MALQVNKTLNADSGLQVAAGGYITLRTTLPDVGLSVSLQGILRKDAAAYAAQERPIDVVEIQAPTYKHEFADETEFLNFVNATDTYDQTMQMYKDYLISTGNFVDADLTIV